MKNPFHIQNKLDEMQTQKLLTISDRGFWGTWTALLIAVIAQAVADVPPEQYMAEGIILMLMCVYGLEEYLRNGIWTSFDVKPNARTNALWSALAGAGLTVFTLVRNSRQDWWQWSYWPGAVVGGVFTFGLTFAVLQAGAWLYYKRREALDQEPEEPEEDQTTKN